jgi:hypothetical protein
MLLKATQLLKSLLRTVTTHDEEQIETFAGWPLRRPICGSGQIGYICEHFLPNALPVSLTFALNPMKMTFPQRKMKRSDSHKHRRDVLAGKRIQGGVLMMVRSQTLLLALLFNMGCSVFGIRTAEELKYEVVEEQDPFEIRVYETHICAEASMDGDYGDVQGDLFRVLAGYIFGKNTAEEKIAMTAPVLMDPQLKDTPKNTDGTEPDSEATSIKVAMTAPVTMEQSQDGNWKMAFSMPSTFTMQTLPRPIDQRVKLVEVPTRTVAVIGFSGLFGNEENRAEQTRSLMDWLGKKTKYRVRGKPFFAGYDPPFTLPFLRRNEVLVVVELI